MPTNSVTPRVIAKMALMFFAFRLPKALWAMRRLALSPVNIPPIHLLIAPKNNCRILASGFSYFDD